MDLPSAGFITANIIVVVVINVRHYLGAEFPQEELAAVIEEAYAYADEEYGEADALAWAGGYEIPQEAVDEDEAALARHGGDFDALVTERLSELALDRLNPARIEGLRADNPERERLLELAQGMPIPLPAGLTPNGAGERPPLRRKYLRVAAAVNKMVMGVRDQRLAFVLCTDTAQRIPGLHLALAHWATKKLKRQGRPLLDASDESAGSLKSADATAAVREMWGPIRHPTIVELVQKLLHFVDRETARDATVSWDDVVVFKMDLRGAFNLTSIRPGHAQRLALELTGGRVIIFICGMFGWTGTPFAFDVVTRALRHELTHALYGSSDMYADDLMAMTLRRALKIDMATAEASCTGLMGPNAVEETKTHSTDNSPDRTIDLIGYELSLALRTLSISRFNFLRAIYGFFSVDPEEPVPVPTLERLASWAERYATICPWLRPFVRFLYNAYAGRRRTLSLPLDDGARLAIRLWRAGLCALRLDPARFARPFESFRAPTARYVAEFDSCLWGAGAKIFVLEEDGSERLLGGSAASLAALEFGEDSSYQNTAEFIGAILALVTARLLGITELSVGFRGDSVSALAWIDNEHVRSEHASNAAVFFTLLVMQWRVQTGFIQHIRGEDNTDCDALSRDPFECTMATLGHSNAPHVTLNTDPRVAEILQLCDPGLDIRTEAGFQGFWRRAHAVLAAL